ncbi:secretory lipase [Ophiostoma piceae UAMH 11346]|uniref:Secretory lipase n=1 Tax=Ophiostoma piceae (strain UAMH 11346) TaxID=1262450 RepID=S3D306_OPHP1|nr:secretory lipase [Ophiostoma piceae UAMH 11346]
MRASLISLGLSALAGLTGLAAAVPVVDKRTTTLPTDDPFYSVPGNIASYAPGAIIQHRAPPAPIAAFGLDPVKLAATWQIQYRTTDNLGNATATVLTVLVPKNAKFGKVLSYQVAEDAASPNCAPSYALQLASASGGLLGTILTQAEILLVEAALYQGWVVVLPDHEGPHAAYLANRLAGYATLDGIRAALASNSITGIKSTARVGMWGYSGGGIASSWAAALQAEYAPELSGKLVGAAVGGIVPNISTVITSIDRTAEAGIIATGIEGLANQYPYIETLLQNHLLDEHKAKFAKVKTQCLTPNVIDFLFADVSGMLDDPSLLTSPEIMSILDENALLAAPAPPASIPLYIYKSLNDEISPIADTDKLVKQYCAAGSNVHYLRDIVSNHGALAVTGAPKALAWLIDRLDGKAAASSCKTETTITSLLDLSTISVLPGILLGALAALLGGGVGPAFFG